MTPPGGLLLLLLLSPARFSAEALSMAAYLNLLENYRAGRFQEAAEDLLEFPRNSLRRRNEDLLRRWNAHRPDEARKLRQAIALNAEAAFVAELPRTSETLLDETVRLSRAFPQAKAIAIQKRVHLAVTYRLYAANRLPAALRVSMAASSRYREDPDVQFAAGTLAELAGWLNASEQELLRAERAYRTALRFAPSPRTRVHLARVLVLLGRYQEALSLLPDEEPPALEAPDRVVRLLTRGDALRKSGNPADAVAPYRRARELDRSCQATHVALAYALRELGRSDEALAVLKEGLPAAGDSPRDSFRLYLLGDARRHFSLWRELRETGQ